MVALFESAFEGIGVSPRVPAPKNHKKTPQNPNPHNYYPKTSASGTAPTVSLELVAHGCVCGHYHPPRKNPETEFPQGSKYLKIIKKLPKILTLHNYYPKTEYLILGSLGALGFGLGLHPELGVERTQVLKFGLGKAGCLGFGI